MLGNWRPLIRCAMRVGLCTALGISSAFADDKIPDVSASLTLGSDYFFRGVSQTLGGAAVQASVDAEFESGFYAFVWGSNVDFIPDGEPDDGADLEIDVAVGFASDLTEQWSVDATLVRYILPGTVGAASYDYNELLATLWYEERYSATLAYSNNVFGSNANGLLASLGAHYELPAGLSLDLEYGHYDLDDAYDASYSYANVGIGRTIGEIAITLAYHDTFGDAQELFYAQSISPSLVLTIDIGFSR